MLAAMTAVMVRRVTFATPAAGGCSDPMNCRAVDMRRLTFEVTGSP